MARVLRAGRLGVRGASCAGSGAGGLGGGSCMRRGSVSCELQYARGRRPTGRRSECGWVEDCEGSIELPLSAVGEGREAVAVARQARVCPYAAGFYARTRDAMARKGAAAEVAAYAFE